MRRKRPSGPRVKLNPVAVWELLDELGISQKELARRSGISAGYLSQLIRGEAQPLGADAETVAAGPGRERLGQAVLH